MAPASCWQALIASQPPIGPCRLEASATKVGGCSSWRQHLAGRRRSPRSLRSAPAGWKPAPRRWAGAPRGASILLAGADRLAASDRPLPAGSQRHEGGQVLLVAPASCRQAPVASQTPIGPCRLEASATKVGGCSSWRQHLAGIRRASQVVRVRVSHRSLNREDAKNANITRRRYWGKLFFAHVASLRFGPSRVMRTPARRLRWCRLAPAGNDAGAMKLPALPRSTRRRRGLRGRTGGGA